MGGTIDIRHLTGRNDEESRLELEIIVTTGWAGNHGSVAGGLTSLVDIMPLCLVRKRELFTQRSEVERTSHKSFYAVSKANGTFRLKRPDAGRL